ncbi:transcription factor RF2b-like [Panicum miliaceum]|uniref:Transcription factor RF2b-like n=1 Tax=Panicum miliaceum TaxID=4540 RepID=A0A3L6SGS2_PANMI|nr:transcription factor RF2b-like [Panicum miliaceum]
MGPQPHATLPKGSLSLFPSSVRRPAIKYHPSNRVEAPRDTNPDRAPPPRHRIRTSSLARSPHGRVGGGRHGMNTANGNGLAHHHHVQASMPPPHQKQRPGLPPTPPPSAPGSHSLHHAGACADDGSAAQAQAQGGLPPRRAHRRSRSDVAFGYFQPLPPPSLTPKVEAGGWGGLPGGAAGDDLFNAYMSMEGMDGLNNSDGDSRGSSGMRTNGADSSENESEDYGGGGDSQFLLWGDAGRKKRNAAGEPAPPPPARHARSPSMDSLMGKLSFSANGEPSRFSLEFGGGEFTPAEMKRIMADEKLADPKRGARQQAVGGASKERRMRYIAELEQKVQILQTEATTLSAQLTLLQRDSAGLATQNNELKFRLQAMEQQAQLRDGEKRSRPL